MKRIVGKCFRFTECTAKITILAAILFFKRLVFTFRSQPNTRELKRVYIIQFAPRLGMVGGDAVANGYIRRMLETSGVEVVLLHPEPVGRGVGFGSWLFGDLWEQNRKLARSTLGRNSQVLIDSQLSLGFFQVPTVTICHFSFLGYTSLATENVDFLGHLYSAQRSLVQAIGCAGSRVVAVSEFQASFLRRELVDVSRVVGNVQLLQSGIRKRDRKGFVFLGSHAVHAKGIDVLKRLASELQWDIHCFTDFSGPGPLHYHPFVSHEKIPDTLQNYQILLHPSRYESCSMAVLEGLSCGLPVIISNVGIGPELRKHIPEFVVTANEPEVQLRQYQEKAQIILADYEYFSAKALEYVSTYHSIKQFEASWRSVFHLDTNLP